MHYYKKNIGDYAKKAGRLSILQHGVYNLLIDACYDREEFPTLEQAIDWVWASSKEEVEAVEFVLRKFFTLSDAGLYVQKRVEEELFQYQEMSANNKRIAIERETKRAKKYTKRVRSVNDSPPNQEPLTNNHKQIKELSSNDDPVNQIFAYWVDTMSKKPGMTKLTPKRKKAVSARLKDGYTQDQIKLAILNCSKDSWSMGANDRQAPFNDLELICRTGEKLESFIDKPGAGNAENRFRRNPGQDRQSKAASIRAATFGDDW